MGALLPFALAPGESGSLTASSEGGDASGAGRFNVGTDDPDEAAAPYPLDVIIVRDGIVAFASTHCEPDATEAVILELLAR